MKSYKILFMSTLATNKSRLGNPSKFQAILFKCRKNEEVFDLNIADELIKLVTHVKLLGVLIDGNLRVNVDSVSYVICQRYKRHYSCE